MEINKTSKGYEIILKDGEEVYIYADRGLIEMIHGPLGHDSGKSYGVVSGIIVSKENI